MTSAFSPRPAARPAARPTPIRRAILRPVLAGALGFSGLAVAVLGGSTLGETQAVASYALTPAASAHARQVAADNAAAVSALTLSRAQAVADRSEVREQVRRKEAAATKAAAAKAAKRKAAAKAAKRLAHAQANPTAVAQQVMGEFGFGADQWDCLHRLWIEESNWNYRASNASSGAYGIPQSLPGRKMAAVAGDWQTNPETQIRWGLNYIKQSYGSPCGALSLWQSRYPHWY